jgi:PAS domain S-box-containing protein
LLVIYLNGKRLKGINLKLEKQIEERTIEIREQNKELEKLSIVASETDNSVMIYDEDYNLEWVNDGEIRNFGYTLEEIYKKFGRTIIELSFYPKINEVIKEIEETKNSGHYNSKGIRKDGSEIWSRTTLTPIIGENGKIKKIIAIDSDITELKYAEEKIRAQHILITQSLEYAKKIQDAVLPSLSSLKKEVEDAFILFKPKDIVSGDFFWMHNISGKIIVATADCTGHGVPGGFMSMIGNSLMNEIVKEKHITSPSYILSLMDEKINDLFSKSESGQADGMDVAIATIDKKEGIIEIASANQSMYIIDDDEIIEFEGDIWSIGGVFSKKATGNFKSKIINITENTRLYMSSDGYQDQFGGSNDTKILKPNFIKLLKENSDKPLIEQEKNIEKFLESWVGNGKQTDDILVIGIKM